MPLTSTKAKSMNAARQARYTPQQQTQGARDGRWRKLLATVDPSGSLDEAERNRRAMALMKSQMLDLTAKREAKRQAAKANTLDNKHYAAARTSAVHGCMRCNPALPHTAIDVMCPAHLAEQRKAFSH
jgi:hypothetical protein